MKKIIIILGIVLMLSINLAAQAKIYWVDDSTGKVQRRIPTVRR